MRLATLIAACGLGIATLAQAQVEETELDDVAMEQAPRAEETPLPDELIDAFAQAEATFQSIDQPAALAQYEDVIGRLTSRLAVGRAGTEGRAMLARSLARRAQIQFNLGELAEIDADLTRALMVLPSFDIDRAHASPKLVDQFDRMRDRTVGYLNLADAQPGDLTLRIDGLEVDAFAGLVGALAGTRRLDAERAGFASQTLTVEVEAGTTTPVELLLERVAPVLRLHTRPRGATVMIDGVVRGVTEGTAAEGFVPEGAPAHVQRQSFSDVFELTDLTPGVHQLEVRLTEHRPYQATLRMLDLIDYEIPPIVLEREQGTLLIDALPADATVRINGTIARLERDGSRPRLALAPGDHHVVIDRGPAHMFTSRFTIADRQTVELRVELKPGLALLGILGEDRTAASRVERTIRRALGDSDRWTIVDHAAGAADALAAAGAQTEALRRAAAASLTGERPRDEVDWRALQGALSDRLPGLVYVLGITSNDLLATHADLFVLPAAPGPPRPDRLRISLDDDDAVARLAAPFHNSVQLRRPWLGAQVIDSTAAPHPVVVDVTPGSPAETAGIVVGDQIAAVAQVPVTRASGLAERVAVAEIGETVTLGILSPGGGKQVDVTLGASPHAQVSGQPDRLAAITFADLTLLEERADTDARWIVQLNRAGAHLAAASWIEAARELRTIEAPENASGIGQATVDYWLGVALEAAGSDYRDSARAAFARAAAVPGARLDHNDGPWLEPRARARLAALDTSLP